ncbi:MAG TPA: DUF3147 family protein, partial [Streptosporangiaceae bacterium]
MPTPVLIFVKAVNGGLFVALFAVLGEMLQPKRFAGIFGASPAVALANLLIIALVKGDGSARSAATGMIAGAIGLAVACAAAIPAVRRWGALRGSALLWGAWILVSGAAAVPIVGTAAAAGAGPPVGHRTRRRRKNGPLDRNGNGRDQGGERDAGDSGHGNGAGDGAHASGGRQSGGRQSGGHDGGGERLFAVDIDAVREIRPGALAARFAFGFAVSVVAGLIGVAAGQRAGGVMLAAPAVLPATLTIIERREGRGPAVTEAQGSVPGAVALIGFALVAAATTARIPLAGALFAALATW